MFWTCFFLFCSVLIQLWNFIRVTWIFFTNELVLFNFCSRKTKQISSSKWYSLSTQIRIEIVTGSPSGGKYVQIRCFRRCSLEILKERNTFFWEQIMAAFGSRRSLNEQWNIIWCLQINFKIRSGISQEKGFNPKSRDANLVFWTFFSWKQSEIEKEIRQRRAFP